MRLGADATKSGSHTGRRGPAVSRRPTTTAFTAKVTVAAAASTTLEIGLPAPPTPGVGGGPVREPEPAAAPQPAPLPEPPAASPERPWQKTAAWVTGGVGVVFLAGGITAQFLYASKIDAFNSVSNAPNPGRRSATSP